CDRRAGVRRRRGRGGDGRHDHRGAPRCDRRRRRRLDVQGPARAPERAAAGSGHDRARQAGRHLLGRAGGERGRDRVRPARRPCRGGAGLGRASRRRRRLGRADRRDREPRQPLRPAPGSRAQARRARLRAARGGRSRAERPRRGRRAGRRRRVVGGRPRRGDDARRRRRQRARRAHRHRPRAARLGTRACGRDRHRGRSRAAEREGELLPRHRHHPGAARARRLGADRVSGSRLRRLLGGVAGAAGAIAVLTVASRVLGFGRWMVQSATVGPTATGDAYAVANLLPNVLYEVVAGGALAGVVVPLLAAPVAKRLREEVDDVASALLTWVLVVLAPLGLAVALLARPIAGLLPVPTGADQAAVEDLTTYFLVVFSPQVPLYGVGIVLTGVLQAHRRFMAPAIVPIASTLVVVAGYLVFGRLAQGLLNDPAGLSDPALAVLAWGTTAGVVALSLPLLVPVLRCGVRLRPRLSFPPGVARRLGHLAAAGVGGVLAQQVAVLVVMVQARSGGVAGTFNVF